MKLARGILYRCRDSLLTEFDGTVYLIKDLDIKINEKNTWVAGVAYIKRPSVKEITYIKSINDFTNSFEIYQPIENNDFLRELIDFTEKCKITWKSADNHYETSYRNDTHTVKLSIYKESLVGKIYAQSIYPYEDKDKKFEIYDSKENIEKLYVSASKHVSGKKEDLIDMAFTVLKQRFM